MVESEVSIMALDTPPSGIRRPMYNKVLPLVYDDSLSYIEVLEKLRYKVNELVDYVDEFGQSVIEEAKAYTDAQKAEYDAVLAQTIITINNTVSQFERQMENQFTDFKANVNLQMTAQDIDIQNFKKDVNTRIDGIQSYLDYKFVLYDKEIKKYIANQIFDVMVINYFTGERVPLQEMFNYLAQLHVEDAYTYEEISNLNKTYGEVITIVDQGDYDYLDLIRRSKLIIQ